MLVTRSSVDAVFVYGATLCDSWSTQDELMFGSCRVFITCVPGAIPVRDFLSPAPCHRTEPESPESNHVL